jgi:predicted helicase
MGRPRFEMMKNIISKDNLSICLLRSLIDTTNFSSVFISKNLVDKNLYGFQTSLFPLYIYPNKTNQQNAFETTERVPNLNMEIVNQIATGLGLTFTNEKEETPNTFAPIDLLDYIYAVLHSPSYREKYKEFLKIDFPRVPFPHHSIVGTGRDLSVQDIQNNFWQLVKLGGELRQIHLLESPVVEKYITQYPEDGNNVVTKPKYQDNNVFINDTQYFANVPEIAWNFYIGGYQPAQKWLKDRKDRELSYEDILHYQKMIVALTETDRIMKEIDTIEIE